MTLEILNNMPWVWLALAILMTIVEGLTLGLTTVWLAIAALICMVLAFFIPSVSLQIIIFLLLSLGMILITRPIAVKKLKMGREKTNLDRIVGTKAMVIKAVGPDEPGQVKVAGKIWTARLMEGENAFPPGAGVKVVRMEGVTLIVDSWRE